MCISMKYPACSTPQHKLQRKNYCRIVWLMASPCNLINTNTFETKSCRSQIIIPVLPSPWSERWCWLRCCTTGQSRLIFLLERISTSRCDWAWILKELHCQFTHSTFDDPIDQIPCCPIWSWRIWVSIAGGRIRAYILFGLAVAIDIEIETKIINTTIVIPTFMARCTNVRTSSKSISLYAERKPARKWS